MDCQRNKRDSAETIVCEKHIKKAKKENNLENQKFERLDILYIIVKARQKFIILNKICES